MAKLTKKIPQAFTIPKGSPVTLLDQALAGQFGPGVSFLEKDGIITPVLDEEPKPVIEQFLESTYTLPKKIPNKRRRGLVETAMIRYRPLLKQANRFFLDDEFTELATRLSVASTPEVLQRRLLIATLPYAVTWIEFNLRKKVQTSIALSDNPNQKVSDKTPERIGLLLVRDSHRDTAWAMTMIGEFDGMGSDKIDAAPHQATHIFDANPDPRLHSMDTAGYSPFHISVTRNRAPGERMMAALKNPSEPPTAEGQHLTRGLRGFGWGYHEKPTMENRKPTGNLIDEAATTPDFLLRHNQIAISPMYLGLLNEYQKEKDDEGLEKWMVDYTHDLIENSGILRWTITVLAMLNEVPIKTTQIQPHGSRRLGHSDKPFMDYHKVTLKLPKSKPISFVERALDHAEARHHRAHMVREHWRTYVTEFACKPAEHDWIYDHENGYRLCSKCESQGRRIHEHQRGDASLGWVRKDYVLEKEKQ